MNDRCEKNTDKEIWRQKEGDFYSSSIHVTETGGISIDVGGHVIVMSIDEWFLAGKLLKGEPIFISGNPRGHGRIVKDTDNKKSP